MIMYKAAGLICQFRGLFPAEGLTGRAAGAH